jgi:hypothetical protein
MTLILGGLYERHAVQSGICVPTSDENFPEKFKSENFLEKYCGKFSMENFPPHITSTNTVAVL